MPKREEAGRPAFTETLRALDDAGLDVYEFRLMIHYWRVGVCWESVRTTAKATGMSVGQVSKTRQRLLDTGRIQWTQKGNRMGVAVNPEALNAAPECSPHEQTDVAIVHTVNTDVHHVNTSVHHMNAILNGPLKSTNEEEEGPAPATALQVLTDHFVSRTALQPAPGNYHRDWRNPLDAILLLAGNDPPTACALMDRALAVARGDNEQHKVYTVGSPRSLVGIAGNLAAAQQAQVAAVDADALWRQALAVVTGAKTGDSRLLTAIRAIGADRIRMAREVDAGKLKQELAHGYYRIPTPA